MSNQKNEVPEKISVEDAIKEIQKHCGFYRKENYTDGPPTEFCDMRHLTKSKFPDFYPNCGKCNGSNCPIIEICQKIEI